MTSGDVSSLLFFPLLVSQRAVLWLAKPGPHPPIGEKKGLHCALVA